MADNTTGTELGIIQIESKKLTNIDNFLKDDENITRVECPFPNVTSAVSAFENCVNLESFSGDFNNLTDGTSMFRNCSSLESIKTDFDNLSLGINMFYNCENLNRFECTAPNITDGYNMFRYCSSLANDSILTENFTTYIIDGLGMFQGTAITQIPWTFPNLVRSRQLFRDTQISGHLSLNMPNQFPNVSLENYKIYSNNDNA